MPAATIETKSADFGVLSRQVREAGLLDRRFGYYGIMIPLTIAAFGVGFAGLVLVGGSWWALGIAAFLGLAFTQLGFVGHDAGHYEVFRSRRWNRYLGLAVGNVLIGMSFGWWVPKHSAHHADPNEVGRDPDVGDGGAAVPSADGQPPVAKWPSRFMTKWQAPLFFPLMVLRSTGIYVLGIQRLIRQRDRAAVVEGALLSLHAALYLAIVFWVLSPLKAVVFIVIQQAVFSVYLGCSFAPNHKGMPLIDPELKMSFVRRQVISSRNVAGGWFTNVALGGSISKLSTTSSRTCPGPTSTCAEHRQGFLSRQRPDLLPGQPDRFVPPDDPLPAGGCARRRQAAARHGSSPSMSP